jgi:hypothetical protein
VFASNFHVHLVNLSAFCKVKIIVLWLQNQHNMVSILHYFYCGAHL